MKTETRSGAVAEELVDQRVWKSSGAHYEALWRFAFRVGNATPTVRFELIRVRIEVDPYVHQCSARGYVLKDREWVQLDFLPGQLMQISKDKTRGSWHAFSDAGDFHDDEDVILQRLVTLLSF